MKQKFLSIFIILSFIACLPTVSADLGSLADSTVISISLVNYDPNPAMAGNVVEARIGVENIGGMDINDLMLEVVPEYPFQLVSGETAAKSIGIIQGYTEGSNANIKIIKYRLMINKDTPAGSYELKVKYYQSGSTSAIQKSLSLDVKNRDSAEIIHIDTTSLVPGKQTAMKFTINNVGSAPLSDLTFYWENTDNIILPVGSDNTKHIKYIDIDQGQDVEYQVIADTNAAPGLYKLNLYLTYKDNINRTEKKISTIAGMYVGGGTDFDVAFSDNSNSMMSFTIANIGSTPANSVSVVLPQQRGWTISGSNSVIIGNLNKGDYTVASFKLQSSTSNQSTQNRGTRNLNNTQGRLMQGQTNGSSDAGFMQRQTNNSADTVLIQIAYTDTMGVRKFVDKEVKVASGSSGAGTASFQGRAASQQTSASTDYTYYLLGLIVVVGGFVLQRRYVSRKMLDPEFKIRDIFKSPKK
ncbi:MAG: COG1361 S-layer family protein [Candidatus Methanoperedens sp.]|nr:COG1361 S-layer family protein [Candidatus Methanoperedens sp.]